MAGGQSSRTAVLAGQQTVCSSLPASTVDLVHVRYLRCLLVPVRDEGGTCSPSQDAGDSNTRGREGVGTTSSTM